LPPPPSSTLFPYTTLFRSKAERTEEIPFMVARVLLQDFTGVPLLVDLAAMRSAAARFEKDPRIIEPLVPVDLVIDHSVQVDFARSEEHTSELQSRGHLVCR